MKIFEELRLITGLSSSDLTKLIVSAPARYKVYPIKKKNGGTRIIAQPSKEVKLLQRAVDDLVLVRCPIHRSATAYEEGTSILKNAAVHANSRVILKLDFRSFFPSFRPSDWKTYAKENLELDDDSLTACERILFWGAGMSKPICLSIGAPTSPRLSNILMYRLDIDFQNVCDLAGVKYTRYADDITLSSDSIEKLTSCEKKIASIISKSKSPKLVLNDEKRGIYTNGRKRSITGLNITPDGLISIGRDKKREISSLIHKYSLGILAPEDTYRLKGLLAFAIGSEPVFVDRMVIKYGNEIIDSIRKLHIPPRSER